MSIIRFKIDEKSLFLGLKNDFKRGQTATVSTPINQSKDPEKHHKDIEKLYHSGLEIKDPPEMLIDKCTNKTTSQANSRIPYFFCFKNLYLDGVPLNTEYSFGLYIKEETDKFIINKKNRRVPNTHLGRRKLHYPITLHYRDDKYNIDNAKVMDEILKQNGEYAYIVRGFECDTDKKTLNFITSLIGEKGAFLSSVFRVKKGVGKKLRVESFERERKETSNNPNKETNAVNKVREKLDKINKTRIASGDKGEQYVYDHLKELISEYVEDVIHTSKKYPLSPYDIEYMEKGVKKFIEVKSSVGDKVTFNMSKGEFKFMAKYKDVYTLIFVSDVKNPFPTITKFTYDDILKMKESHPRAVFSK